MGWPAYWRQMLEMSGFVDPGYLAAGKELADAGVPDPFYSPTDILRSAYFGGVQSASEIKPMDRNTFLIQFVKLFRKDVVAYSEGGLEFGGNKAKGVFIGELCAIKLEDGSHGPGIMLSSKYQATASVHSITPWCVADHVFDISKFDWIIRANTYLDIGTKARYAENESLKRQLAHANAALSSASAAAVASASAASASPAPSQPSNEMQFMMQEFTRAMSRVAESMQHLQAPQFVADSARDPSIAIALERNNAALTQFQLNEKFEKDSRTASFMVDLGQEAVLRMVFPKGAESAFAPYFRFKAPGDLRDTLIAVANKCLSLWTQMNTANNVVQFVMTRLPKAKEGGINQDAAFLLQRALSVQPIDYTMVAIQVMRYDDSLKEYYEFMSAAHTAWFSDWDSATFKDHFEKSKAVQFSIGPYGEFVMKKVKAKNH